MKKVLSYIMVMTLLLTALPSAAAENMAEQDYTLYTFENGAPEGVSYESGAGELAAGAYGNGLCVEPEGGEAAVLLPFYGESHVRYRASVWVKAEGEAVISLGGVPMEMETTTNGEDGWVHYEGVATLPEDAPQTAYISVTAGGSFVIDDCMVYSEKRQARAYGNEVANGTFDTDLSQWTYAGCTLEHMEGGANGTSHAMSIKVNSDWGCAKETVNIYFGRTYKVSWYAKAISEDAVGLDMKYIFDRAGTREDLSTPKYFEKTVGALTEEWQYFELEHKELNLTTDQCAASLYFRAGTGKDRVTFAIDEVVIEEVDNTYAVDSQVTLTGNQITRDAVTATIYKQGNTEGVYYRFMDAFGAGYAVTDSGYTTEAILEKSLLPEYSGTCRVEINAKDINGIVGKTFFSYWSTTEFVYEESLITNIHEEIWTPATETITAEAICRSTGNGEPLSAYLAAYDEKGALVQVAASDVAHTAGEETTVSIDARHAESAKLMLFDKTSLKPLKPADEIKKTTEGTFLYVDAANGRDFNSGTADEPLKTLSGAKVKVRSLLPTATEDIYVVFKEGEYHQASTVTLNENDSSENVTVTYAAEKKGKTSFTGGLDVENFELWDADQNIYRAYVGTDVRSRQFFVDGIRATRARSEGGLENAVNLGSEGVGFTTTDLSLLSYKHIEDLEFSFFEEWTHSYVGVKSVSDNGDGTATVAMRDLDWHYQWNEKGNCFPSVPEYIENALELLDEEGEWYLDTHEGYLYYKPRVFEDMASVRAILPICEKMLKLKGDTAFSPIRNMEFRGIVFENTTWNVPSDPGGFCCGQNNGYPGGEEQFIPGAVHVENAHNIAFINCRFARLGMTGLKMFGALKSCKVIGNEFYDISAGALVVGDVSANTAHNPPDAAYLVENIDVTDNYMHKIAVDYKGGAGLSTGFPINSSLLNNEIYDTSYSGMHLGWGWNSYSVSVTEDFTVKANYIHKVMNTDIYDGGGVYFLGRTNGSPEHPNRFEENYLYDIGNAYGMIYPDNGSTNWDILSNVTDLSKTPIWHRNYEEGDDGYNLAARWLHIHMSTITDILLDNNYTTTAEDLNNGITNVVNRNLHVHPDANWPEEAKEIIARAGITERYADNFRYGLQEVDVETEITLSPGDTRRLNLLIQTAKEKLYDPANYSIYTVSENPAVAQYEDGSIAAETAGETVITLYVKEADLLQTKKIHVTVE